MEPLSEEAITRLNKLGGPVFLGKMIDLFLKFGAEKIQEAKEALARRDYAAVGKAAHALKSSAGNVGALLVGQIAADLERRAAAGEGPGLAEGVSELGVAFQQVEPLLEAKRREASSGSCEAR